MNIKIVSSLLGRKGVVPIVAVSFTLSSLPAATVLQVDLHGDSSIPDPIGNWNVVKVGDITTPSNGDPTTAFIADLTDFETGSGSDVAMTLSSFSIGTTGFNGVWTETDWVESPVADTAFQTIGTATVTLDGLNPLSTYRVEVVAGFPINILDGSDYRVNGEFADGHNTEFPVPTPIGQDWVLEQALFTSDWMIWESVVAEFGRITITVVPSGIPGPFENTSALNAFRIEEIIPVPVPEPTAALLGLVAILGFSLSRRRKDEKLAR